MADLIVPQNSLKRDLKKTEIRDTIISRINKFEDINKYKVDTEFIKLICNLIEYYVKKKYNINKKDLFFEIHSRIFPLVIDEEKVAINKIIEFIFENGHIKKLSYYKLFVSCFSDWVKKKIL